MKRNARSRILRSSLFCFLLVGCHNAKESAVSSTSSSSSDVTPVPKVPVHIPVDGTSSLKYEYDKEKNEYSVSDCSPMAEAVSIPALYNDGVNGYHAVSGISKDAFYPCMYLSSVTFPDSVNYIGDGAFRDCTSLTSIVLPEGTTYIGESAFENSALTSIVLPEGVVNIAFGAFMDCASLTSVSLPQSLEIIGDFAFAGCTSLSSIRIPKGVSEIDTAILAGCTSMTDISVENTNTAYSSSGNCLINAKTKEIIAGCKSSIIPTDGSVTSIGQEAFAGINGLSAITIPSPIKEIKNGAFYSCINLATATLPNTLESIYLNAFRSCTALSSIVIPDSVKIVGQEAFGDCTSLSSVTLSSTLSFLGGYTFYNCTSLSSITLPATLTTINQNPFVNCSSLSSIQVSADNTRYKSVDNCLIDTKSKALVSGCRTSVLPGDGSLTYLGAESFSGCTGLTSVTIPYQLNTLGKSVFAGCTFLRSIVAENVETSKFYTKKNCLIERSSGKIVSGCQESKIPTDDNVLAITKDAFSNNPNLKSVTIPGNIRSIENGAFAGCSGLETIQVSSENKIYRSYQNCLIDKRNGKLLAGCRNSVLDEDSYVNTIACDAFIGCSSLTKLTIPCTVNQIEDYAFQDCSSLSSIKLPDSVSYIGVSAFQGCSSLTSFTIPTKVSIVEGNTFYGCSSLEKIIISARIQYVGQGAFNKCSKLDIYFEESCTPTKYSYYLYHQGRKLYWHSDTKKADGKHWHYQEDDATPEVWEE